MSCGKSVGQKVTGEIGDANQEYKFSSGRLKAKKYQYETLKNNNNKHKTHPDFAARAINLGVLIGAER